MRLRCSSVFISRSVVQYSGSLYTEAVVQVVLPLMLLKGLPDGSSSNSWWRKCEEWVPDGVKDSAPAATLEESSDRGDWNSHDLLSPPWLSSDFSNWHSAAAVPCGDVVCQVWTTPRKSWGCWRGERLVSASPGHAVSVWTVMIAEVSLSQLRSCEICTSGKLMFPTLSTVHALGNTFRSCPPDNDDHTVSFIMSMQKVVPPTPVLYICF